MENGTAAAAAAEHSPAASTTATANSSNGPEDPEQEEDEQASPDPKGKNACCADDDQQQQQGQSQEPPEDPSAPDMDEHLWGNLPEHLLDIILARLPPATFLRLRTVCKKWSTAISSRSFLAACSRVASRRPFLLMFADHFHRRVAAVYDTHTARWHTLPFAAFMRCRFPESFLVLAAAAGLLCLEGTGSHTGLIFTSNPLARTSRRLPPMIPMKSPYVVGMIPAAGDTYQILVAQDGETLASQLYHSATDRWEIQAVHPKRTAILAGAALYRGLLYCLTFSPNGMLAFDPVAGGWSEVNLGLPAALTCPNLMTHRGTLLLIGGVEEFGSMSSVHIWELREGGSDGEPGWVERLRVPEGVFKRLFTACSGHFICVGYGDYVCLHEYYSPEILLLDLVAGCWRWLPGCPLNENIEARSVLGFAFQPRIEAVP